MKQVEARKRVLYTLDQLPRYETDERISDYSGVPLYTTKSILAKLVKNKIIIKRMYRHTYKEQERIKYKHITKYGKP